MSKHRNNVKNTKGQFVLSFLLFVSLAVLSLSICAKAYFVNPSSFSAMVTSRDYISALHEDIVEFAYDECEQCSVPSDFVDKAISYDSVYRLESSYIHSALGTSDAYSNEAFDSNLEDMAEKIKDGVNADLKAQGLRSGVTNGSDMLASSITSYAREKVSFAYLDKVQALYNVGGILLIVLIALSAIFAVIFGAMLNISKTKPYQTLRMVAYSFEASALFNFVMVLAVAIVRITKDLVVYPSYLCSALMDFVGKSMLTVTISGLAQAMIALAIITAVWVLKRGNE